MIFTKQINDDKTRGLVTIYRTIHSLENEIKKIPKLPEARNRSNFKFMNNRDQEFVSPGHANRATV